MYIYYQNITQEYTEPLTPYLTITNSTISFLAFLYAPNQHIRFIGENVVVQTLILSLFAVCVQIDVVVET